MPLRIIRTAPSRPATLADVIDRLKQRDDLGEKRRHLISAVTCTGKLLDRQPCEISTDVPELRERLLPIHPVAAGMTTKRLSNLKSDLARALEVTAAMPKPLPKVNRSEEWSAFLARADAPHQARALSRLSRYCTVHGIEPCAVSDEHLCGLRQHLHQRLLTKDPAKLCKEMAQTWNGIVKRNAPSLPLLTVPRAEAYQSAPLSTYPDSLRQDIERYVERLTRPDLFDQDALDKPLRPTTVRNVRAHNRTHGPRGLGKLRPCHMRLARNSFPVPGVERSDPRKSGEPPGRNCRFFVPPVVNRPRIRLSLVNRS